MKISKKALIALACAVITVCITSGVTLSYIFAKTPEVKNSFEPVSVSCTVEEGFDGVTKSNVKVRNTGDISAYVRATFVVTWVSDSGSVYSAAPIEGVDYLFTAGSQNWIKGSDGFYYYSFPVAAGDVTEVLIGSITQSSEAPQGYSLSVHVAATAIQSEPTSAITSVWNVNVLSNGNVTPK